jgi:broad specificity phosphatase PhoE
MTMPAFADSATGVRVYLIRHGQTEWSLSGQHTGRSDIPLTEQGEEEARGLAAWLRPIQFTRILTSPRQRAQRTCALASVDTLAEVEPDLAEWDYGDYEGKRSVDIRRDRPGWNVFRDGCPGGEMPADIAVRADRMIARLETMKGVVALFSHGQFGMALGARWIGLQVLQGQHFTLSTASVSVLGRHPTRPEVRVIEFWNTTSGSLGSG